MEGAKEEPLEASVVLAHFLQTVVLGGHHNILNHQKVYYKLVLETFGFRVLLELYPRLMVPDPAPGNIKRGQVCKIVFCSKKVTGI